MPKYLNTVGFTGCCTARIVMGFGSTPVGSVNTNMNLRYEDLDSDLADIEVMARRSGMALLFATLNSDQRVANRVLKDRGWKVTRWVTKTAHSDKMLRGYYLELDRKGVSRV